ncbi:hypothetical protein AMK25_26515 [Micromonospora sp. TSRI0369]|nr:hypothetical protein AMK25_26515 [Micromonospora sp. TSRI0369]
MHDLPDELWADDPPRSAIADVRTYVGNLYRLTARWCHTRELMRAGEPAQAVPLPEDLAAVYRARGPHRRTGCATPARRRSS